VSHFRVWAPAAQSVDLHVGGERLPMTREERGWWRLSVPADRPEADYSYSIDNGPPLPDPRSPWQPHGVHGASRTVDHSAFGWTDQRWQTPPLSTAVIYELHIGTFTPIGTFESAIEKLEHLTRLGVTHVELMPIAEFPGKRGWGYDGVDLFAPHRAYGGPLGLKRLVDACHAYGLAVLLDVVYNHLGPDGNYLAQFGPYFNPNYGTPWGPALNMDGPGSIEVRRFLCDNARMWLRDYHFDGLRLDAIHAIFDASALHFLEQLSNEIKNLGTETGRRYDLIAENDLNDPRVVTSIDGGGYGLAAQWNDDFHHALHAALTGERLGYYADFGKLEHIAKALKSVYVYDGCESRFRQRTQGRMVQGLSAHRFVGFLQNHDQVGNRAKGDRSGRLLSIHQLKIGAALVLCAPFVPLLFQGEEFGASSPFLYFTDHGDPELAAAVSKGRRQEFAQFGWDPEDIPDPQEPSSFEASKLDWSELEHHPHEELLRWYRTLIALRQSTPGLRDGSLERIEVEFNELERWLVLYRRPIAVVCNFADRRLRLALKYACRPILSSDPTAALHDHAVDLAGESVVILEEYSS
jgi:maltooligosyltrehalose trehalohydrolase